MIKMVMIIYNEALDGEFMDALKSIGVSSYTKIVGVFGKGKASGTHMGDDVWPGKNNMLYIACEESEVAQIMESVKKLRKTFGSEGIKAFVMPIEDVT